MKRKTLVFGFLLLMFSPVLASAYDDYDFNAGFDLNTTKDNNSFAAIGETILRGSFSGDYVFFSLILLVIFGIVMFQARMPFSAVMVIGLTLFLALAGFIEGITTMVVILSIILAGVLIALVLIKYTKKS